LKRKGKSCHGKAESDSGKFLMHDSKAALDQRPNKPQNNNLKTTFKMMGEYAQEKEKPCLGVDENIKK